MGDVHSGSGLRLEVKEMESRDDIERIISHEEIAEANAFNDDSSEYLDSFGGNYTCYSMICDGDIAGIAMIVNIKDDIVCRDISLVDIGFYKKFRGSVAVALSRMAIKKYFNENNINQLLAVIDKPNKAALINAKWAGFELYSENNAKYYLRCNRDGKKTRRLRQS